MVPSSNATLSQDKSVFTCHSNLPSALLITFTMSPTSTSDLIVGRLPYTSISFTGRLLDEYPGAYQSLAVQYLDVLYPCTRFNAQVSLSCNSYMVHRSSTVSSTSINTLYPVSSVATSIYVSSAYVLTFLFHLPDTDVGCGSSLVNADMPLNSSTGNLINSLLA